MDSAGSSGTEDHTSAQDHDHGRELSPVTDAHGNPVDVGILSDGQYPVPQLEAEVLHDDDIIGVSISRIQTHMRAPETPAAEKARALNLPVESFNRILTLTEGEEENDDQQGSESLCSESQSGPVFLDGEASTTTDDRRASRLSLTNSAGPGSEVGDTAQPGDRSLPPMPDLVHREKAQERKEAGRELSNHRRPQSPTSQHHDSETSVDSAAQKAPRNPPPQRLSLAKAFLSAAENKARGRSSSGPTTVFSNLRKFLPDLPSPSFNRSSMSLLAFSNKSTNSSDHAILVESPTETHTTFQWSVQDTVEKQDSTVSQPDTSSLRPASSDHPSGSSNPAQDHDIRDENLLSPISPASTKSRARSNSEGSLYLMKKATGMSTWDDINAYADVTEMANSRFKAITDSFQNSSLRIPKLSVIRPLPKLLMLSEATHHESSTAAGDGNAHVGLAISKNVGSVKGDPEMETMQQRAHPILARALSKTTGDIVVLGGYRGSILRSAQPPHRQLWVPLKVGLNLRKVDLEVGLTREDEERMEETVIPSGILSHIGPIDICRRLLRHMRKCPNGRDNKLRAHDWGYDWRLSPDLLSARLIKFLESLECNQPGTPPEKRGATVVAHSLGGLITRHAVNQRPDLFAGVVYAGVPQHCVNILGPMRNGDDVLLSSKVLTAQVNFTFRTSYALLPEDGHCFLQKNTNKRYDLDFFDAHTWEEYRLSPCVNPPLHRHHHRAGERRKSIMGALSETISVSSKKGSAQQMVENANQRITDKAMDAARTAEDPAGDMVGPSMKQSQNAQHRPSVATACSIPKDVAMEYLDRTLREVRTFKEQLTFNPVHQENNVYPPHGFIYGKTVPTVYGARVANKEAIKYDDAYDDLAFAAGDGVVLASAAQLPEGYRCVKGGRVESDRGHVGILGDLEAVGRCLEAVVDARAKGVGWGKNALRKRNGSGQV